MKPRFFYQVLPERKIPGAFLTYSSEEDLKIGQLVEVPIKSKQYFGVILSKLEESQISFNLDKVKPISKSYEIYFCKDQIKFLNTLAVNTFNYLNLILAKFLQPFKILLKKDFQSLKKDFTLDFRINSISLKPLPIQVFVESDFILRIMYIIRTKKDDKLEVNKESKNILILVPEKKLLDHLSIEIEKNLKKENLNEIVHIHIYTAEKNSESRETVKKILSKKILENKINIILATRWGLFLPFSDLENIIIVDESNNFFIQESNQVYFDTRDCAFILSQTFQAELNFITQTPSVRLYSFYTEKVLEGFDNINTTINKKLPKIEISTFQSKFAPNDIFSDRIDQILKNEDLNDVYGENFEQED